MAAKKTSVPIDPSNPVSQTPLDQLIPHPMNPRRGDVAKIVESIKVNGFYGVIVAQKRTNYILAGNHRWLAAKELGIESVPVMWLDITDAKAKKILLADNRMNDLASYEQESLQELLRSVLSTDDLRGTGFDATDIQDLIDDVTDEPNEKRKRNLEPFHNTFFLVRCPITEQGRVFGMLKDLIEKEVEGAEIVSATN
jgi:ParB-like nuclease domain